MKKGLKLFLMNFILLLVVSITVMGCSSNTVSNNNNQAGNDKKEAADQNSVKLLFGSWIPATHFVNKETILPWAEYVQKETDGTVKIDVQPGAVLGGSKQVLQDVSGGVYDIGFSAAQYYADTPLFKMTILDLPFAFTNSPDHLKTTKITQKFVDEYVKDEFEKMGLKFIGNYQTDPTKIISSTPIKNINDVKGKKIMIQGFKSEEVIKGWGAVPVSVGVEDMYSALDRDTINATLISPTGVPPHKVYEPAPFLTNFGISNINLFFVMNLDKYKSLSPELQNRFEKEFDPKIADMVSNSYKNTIEKSMEQIKSEVNGKGEIIELSNEQIQEFTKPAKGVWDAWIKEANDRGYNGQELVNGLWKIMEEEGVEPPFKL